MGASGERDQLFACASAVLRLGEPTPIQRENLVGAQDHATGQLGGHFAGLLSRERSRNGMGPGVAGLRLDRAFIELGGDRLDRNAGGFQHRAPNRAARSKDERRASKP